MLSEKITVNKALIFSAVMVIIFTITMIIIYCVKGTVPDSLVVSYFACFGVEGGYCAFIHKLKKQFKQEDEDGVVD